jgi:hypothetical protein
MLDALHNATRAGMAFPDAAFVMNTWDAPYCDRASKCRVPVFSLIKRWDWGRGTSEQADVLLPFFNHFYQARDEGMGGWGILGGRGVLFCPFPSPHQHSSETRDDHLHALKHAPDHQP